MKHKWFREYGWIYLPNKWPGYLITFLVILFDVQVFLAIDKNSHSVSDTLYPFFLYLTASLAILYFIASKTK